jgi:hypothetical protein
MSYSQADILAAYDHFEQNWGELQQSERGACTMCLAEFSPMDVRKLYRFEDGVAYEQPLPGALVTDTARCPKCDLPYVIGDAGLPLTASGYLSAVHKHWHT